MSEDELRRAVDNLEKTMLEEDRAADAELEKIVRQLKEVSTKFPGTPAADRARKAVQLVESPSSPIRPTTRFSPYKFDAKEYKWLRGTISVDRDTNLRWLKFIDDSERAAKDPYGGRILLIGDDSEDAQLLAALSDGEIILVEGIVRKVDSGEKSAAVYKVSSLKRLKVD